MPSVQRGTRRPDLQLYIPGRGLLNRSLKSEGALIADKDSSLQSVKSEQVNSGANSSRHLKTRRPDIQVYVPKAKLFTSRVNGMSHPSLNILPKKEKENEEEKKSSFYCNSQNSSDIKIIRQQLETNVNCAGRCVDYPTLKTKSWADQVEEHLSSSAHLNEEFDEDSFDANISKEESDLMSNVDNFESVYSSGYSSSSNEDLNFMEQETKKCNKTDSSHCILKQNQHNSELGPLVQGKRDIGEMIKDSDVRDQQIAFLEKLLVNDKSIKVKKSLLAQILPHEAPIFPVRVGDEEKIKAREEILDRQIAFFEKLAAKAKSAKPKKKVSAPVVPREAPLFPGRDGEDFLKMLEKRERIVQQQIAMFDKMLAKPETGKSQKTAIFQRLEIPKSSGKSKVREVPHQELPLKVPYSKLDHTLRCPEYLNSQYSPVSLDENLYSGIASSFNVPYTTSNNSFCASECWNSYESSVSLDADFYIPPPVPLNRPPSKLDYTFKASECLDSYSSLSLDADFYIPPPRPRT